ncbi:Gfo/Idh/MocA family protein [Tautonia sociabilis]|uniref:Gfo/Idh/MocA family oxidoreductase n=1 Tax=Tautonia sociabilis TaxID=2080755 RepID=A0A432MIN9_9BACT|nr:Gfo/Idh/MocA family oxidoreductase [Tautonia sociabilis]RUL87221.1 Gfo/Idh/MocA family oxidoreductase [Tautonia sociabilis]
MAVREIRIGIVGAGQITRSRHLPNFQAMPGVSVVGVCNRRRESSARVAREWGIPRIFESWESLVEDDGIDAVVVGTWPYLHCPITLAALDAGKHVLTQARMAMNAREAQRMLDRSRECRHLTTMVVPSPLGLAGDRFVRRLIDDGFLGDLREVHVHSLSDQWASRRSPLHWRQITRYSGFNMLNLGILHETALRWTPPPIRVFARATITIPSRRDPETGEKARVGSPDSVQVLTDHEDGSIGLYRLSGVVRHNTGTSIELYGARGTILYDLQTDTIRLGRTGQELRPMPIPESDLGRWQVEEDFIAAIRGERPVTRTDFLTGARYMQFTEAVARSSRTQAPISLPLKDFSSPDE